MGWICEFETWSYLYFQGGKSDGRSIFKGTTAIPVMVKDIITVRYRDLTGRYRCMAPYFKSRVHIGTTEEGIIY